ncbi:MAG: serine--tRNA ligase [Candidatus Taylorbacteria bacterium CG11_big_fil_rev_8_21_14_0_20_46_11]|uniref:Serine--tRNA ligase n=1 Tax=Candidatus Taylorbacteria bacterium CG11_big_fil_rev_8_21_14_0_20_46_11 TaxID=1975025 RepID=A0A2H0KEY2_9BACT|nr:MAG: serine--tRNA ligase [Candidatus Taylorbacteria bacterium CG11_big_fil_rev_8_21_14_0_20_46_11]
MLDIKFIRENKDLIAMAAQKKHVVFNVDDLLVLDDERRALLATVEEKRAEHNRRSESFVKTSIPERRQLLAEELRTLKGGMEEQEAKLKEVMQKWQVLMLQVPNIPDMSVPEGESDEQNAEVRLWGEKPVFDFPVKGHMELMESLDLADFTRGGDVAGFRGYFLKNEGALLAFALWQFALDHLVKKGFTPMIAPSLVRKQTLLGTGYLPQGEDDLYKTQDDDYLAGTAEVATMSYYNGTTLKASDFPIKFASFSPCFRREAGSHGKDTKGLFRVHEFFKLEQVVLCEASHEASVKLHEELTMNSEELLRALKLPYHVVINCGGDLGLGQVKKYDIETWFPSEQKYRETHSASYFHDFQTRRLNIRYKDGEGKTRFAHSLNNTAVASPRLIIPIIEHYQQADGSVVVPEVLRKYVGKDVIARQTPL